MTEETKLRDSEKIGKLHQKNAEEIFQSVCEYYDVEEDDMAEGSIQRNAFITIKRRLIRAIRDRRIDIMDENGVPVFIQVMKNPPQGVEKRLRYKPIDMACRTAVNDDNNNVRHQQLVGAMTGEAQEIIRQVHGPDMLLMEYIALFFTSA